MKTKEKLSSAIKLLGGGTPKTTNIEYWNGNIPWLSVVDFNTGHKYVYKTEKYITQKGLNESSTQILQEGSIIISARGTVGALAILKKPMAFNQSCYGICGIDGISISDYIYYVLKYNLSELQQISHGGVFSTITRDTFENIEIFLPSIVEQRAIAAVLSSFDDKIDLLHRQNATLEAMAEALFRQWFVVEAKEEWEHGFLPDEFEFVMGQSPNGYSFNEVGMGTPMFQGNADFGFRFPSARIYTTEPTRFAQKFDTLISVRAPVGAQNMAQEKCCIGRGLAAFRYKKNSSFYSYTYFKLRSLLKDILVYNNEGTVFGSISKNDFNNIEIIIPDYNSVLEFENMISSVNDKIILNCQQIHTLEKLRDTLLPKLMSGEVRMDF